MQAQDDLSHFQSLTGLENATRVVELRAQLKFDFTLFDADAEASTMDGTGSNDGDAHDHAQSRAHAHLEWNGGKLLRDDIDDDVVLLYTLEDEPLHLICIRMKTRTGWTSHDGGWCRHRNMDRLAVSI
jgi:hypothetical protein